MSLIQRIWVLVCLGFFVWVGVAVMFGATPGRSREAWRPWAALIDAQVAEHGAVFTGFGIWMVGLAVAAVGLLFRSRGEPDGGSHGGDGWFGGGCDGDGGD